VQFSAYRPVLALPAARAALLLGFFIRIPLFAAGVILTLHVVGALHRSYGAAGVLSTAATVALAVSSPWRGRLLDRKGLRRVVLPSLVVQAVCWSIAPWVDYWWLMALAALGGLFAVPTFSILRQVLMAAVPEEQRRTALSLDSVCTEFSFMAGPALGVWVATVWDTAISIFVFEWLSIIAGIGLYALNPAIRGDHEEETTPPPRRSWFGVPVVAVLAATAATTIVLGGSDVAIVATLRTMDAQQHIGWVLAVWGAGSIVGGLVYGAWHRSVAAFWLLAGLAVVTAPVALAANLPMAAVLLFVSGLFCAPSITATIDTLSRLVPTSARGEAVGWHGSSMTAGIALGAPLAGFAIDAGGWQWGFLVVSAVGLLVAVVCGLVLGRRGSGSASPVDDSRLATAH
jgi:MFS family permease